MIQATDSPIKVAATVIGFMVSLPMVYALIQAGVFFGSMRTAVTTLENAFAAHVQTIESYIERTENRLRDNEGKISVLWDGHDRRKP